MTQGRSQREHMLNGEMQANGTEFDFAEYVLKLL